MKWFPACAALCVLLAAEAAADLRIEAPHGPTIDALLRDADGGDGIWIKYDDKAAQHVQSGLVCPRFIPLISARQDLVITGYALRRLAAAAGPRPRGDDVTCSYAGDERGYVDITVIRPQPGETTESFFQTAKTTVPQRFPDAKFVTDSKSKWGPYRLSSFMVRTGGIESALALDVGAVGDWILIVESWGLVTDANQAMGGTEEQWRTTSHSFRAVTKP